MWSGWYVEKQERGILAILIEYDFVDNRLFGSFSLSTVWTRLPCSQGNKIIKSPIETIYGPPEPPPIII